jgi:proteic killer suppression protein
LIASFYCSETEKLWRTGKSRRLPSEISLPAFKKLALLNAATGLTELAVPPGNQLEALARDRKGQHSIRVNRQWRICFRWQGGAAHDVEIVDYH